jgi:hypothetical protein
LIRPYEVEPQRRIMSPWLELRCAASTSMVPPVPAFLLPDLSAAEYRSEVGNGKSEKTLSPTQYLALMLLVACC